VASDRREVASEAVAGALGALAEVASGGVPGLGASTTAALTIAFSLGSEAIERRRNRMARALETAADIMDVGLDILAERAVGHDARLELLAQVLEAAGRTPLEAKVRALGRVLAEGLQGEDDSTGEAAVLANALADVEAAHVRVLALLKNEPQPLNYPGTHMKGWRPDQLEETMPNDRAVMPAVLAILQGHGLIANNSEEQGGWVPTWRISSLGLKCLQLLGDEAPTKTRQ
jgi:hypothetical protein